MQVVVDEILTNYAIEGSGNNILMLHGWGDSLITFNILAKNLSTKYRVIRLDLPGFGGSETPKEVYDLEKYALFVSNFLDKIDNKDVYAVIGHSNGGAIAIKAVSESTIKPKKLILIASSGVRSTYSGRKKVLRLAAKTAKFPTKLLPKKSQDKLKKKAYGAIGSDLFVAENLQETFKKVISEDIVEQAKNIKVPTLLIYGDSDTATPPNYGEMFEKQINNSKLEIISGAGHFVHQTNNREVETIISKFLGNNR